MLMLWLTDLLTGRWYREITRDNMIQWKHFSDVFITSTVNGDGVDEPNVGWLFECCLHVVATLLSHPPR